MIYLKFAKEVGLKRSYYTRKNNSYMRLYRTINLIVVIISQYILLSNFYIAQHKPKRLHVNCISIKLKK